MQVVRRKRGTVFLVGAGPGDPELITLRGLRTIRRADAVVYDRLIDSRLLDEARPGAELIYVGKRGGHFSFPQEEINRLLVRLARSGKTVVRLKGGDPFLFGRGAEEALHMRRHGVRCEVVPGVSSALAAPLSAGIPVTHRQLSSSVLILSGHQASDAENAVDWKAAASTDTVVVLMPLGNLRRIVSSLVLHGRSLDTPAALVQSGTWMDQRQVVADLRTIVAEGEAAGIESPAILVVGKVVNLSRLLEARAADESSSVPLERVAGAPTGN